MSGGAYNYIEYLPEKILEELEKLENFTEEAKAYCNQDAKAWSKLVIMKQAIKNMRTELSRIDTDFLHRVEWVASGDRSKVYE